MDTYLSYLWPVAVFAGVGSVIDFLIGRRGQERTKEFLIEWWVRFDDVHWRNLGKKEAEFASSALEKLFGRRFLSLRRIAISIVWFAIAAFGGIAARILWKVIEYPDEDIDPL